jgi:glutathione peroxidase-family protein
MDNLIKNYLVAHRQWSAIVASYIAAPSEEIHDFLRQSFESLFEAIQVLKDSGKTSEDLYSYLLSDKTVE